MKKIVIVTYDMYGGGCERVIANLSNWFIDNNIECTIVTESEGPCFYDLKKEVKLVSLDNSGGSNRSIIKSYKKLRMLMRRLKPDLVISMPEKVNIWVALSLFGTGIPVVVSERNNPALYPKSKLKRALRMPCYRLATNGVVFQTQDAMSYFPKYIQNKGVIIHNPLDLNRIPSVESSTERRKEIIGVGRLVDQKNFKLLISAFSEFQKLHNDYVLKIYGEGPFQKELFKYASQILKPDSFLFPGKRSDVLELIKSSEVFVLSSDYEGMPNALIEAMALGLPVISTDCPIGGPRELIKNEVNGLLIPVGDKEALVKALCNVVNNEELRMKISRNALAIRETLEVNKIANEWLNFLQHVRSISKKTI